MILMGYMMIYDILFLFSHSVWWYFKNCELWDHCNMWPDFVWLGFWTVTSVRTTCFSENIQNMTVSKRWWRVLGPRLVLLNNVKHYVCLGPDFGLQIHPAYMFGTQVNFGSSLAALSQDVPGPRRCESDARRISKLWGNTSADWLFASSGWISGILQEQTCGSSYLGLGFRWSVRGKIPFTNSLASTPLC